MNKNTILLIAAGVAAYLLWKKYGKATAVSGIGRLPMPGMSTGSGRSWTDPAFGRQPVGAFTRTGKLAGFDSVESIGVMEFGGGLGFTPIQSPRASLPVPMQSGYSYPSASSGMSMGPIGSPLPSLGSQPGAGMSMGPIGSPLPRLQQDGMTTSGMSLGPIGSPLPALQQSAVSASQLPSVSVSDQANQRAAMLQQLQAAQPQVVWQPQRPSPQTPMQSSGAQAPIQAPPSGTVAPESFGSDSWGGDAGTSEDMVTIRGGQKAYVV